MVSLELLYQLTNNKTLNLMKTYLDILKLDLIISHILLNILDYFFHIILDL